jgi:hypothetical protein
MVTKKEISKILAELGGWYEIESIAKDYSSILKSMTLGDSKLYK